MGELFKLWYQYGDLRLEPGGSSAGSTQPTRAMIDAVIDKF